MTELLVTLLGLTSEQGQAVSVLLAIITNYVPSIGSGLYLIAMYGVFFDKPKLIEKSKKLSTFWDVIQANAGKAKNAPK